MARVTLTDVTRRFGGVTAVDGVSLDVREGEFLTLLGPSGCGKTTTLRMIAGFLPPSRGRIFIDGADVTRLPARRRNIGMVFQDYALFPHLTVAENIGFGLRERRAPRARIAERVRELLALVRLPGLEQRFPAELSGGQQQRVALARALAYTPRVLLMDEPLGALDLKLREAMQIELAQLQQALEITTIYVTHDQEEAMGLSDRIAVMSEGRIVQVGPPDEVYARPLTPFVANFVGKINLLAGTVRAMHGRECLVDVGEERPIAGWSHASLALGQPVQVALRPEHLSMRRGADASPATGAAAVVERRRFLGNLSHYFVRTPAGHRLLVETRGAEDSAKVGDSVWIEWRVETARVFADDGQGRAGRV
jgi:putative spermidine/putrescine transport system ATP-binding protein